MFEQVLCCVQMVHLHGAAAFEALDCKTPESVPTTAEKRPLQLFFRLLKGSKRHFVWACPHEDGGPVGT